MSGYSMVLESADKTLHCEPPVLVGPRGRGRPGPVLPRPIPLLAHPNPSVFIGSWDRECPSPHQPSPFPPLPPAQKYFVGPLGKGASCSAPAFSLLFLLPPPPVHQYLTVDETAWGACLYIILSSLTCRDPHCPTPTSPCGPPSTLSVPRLTLCPFSRCPVLSYQLWRGSKQTRRRSWPSTTASSPTTTVIHSDHKTWELKIRDVRRNDSGEYMCQINTDPMKHQVNTVPMKNQVSTSEASEYMLGQHRPHEAPVWCQINTDPMKHQVSTCVRSTPTMKHQVSTSEASGEYMCQINTDPMKHQVSTSEASGEYMCQINTDPMKHQVSTSEASGEYMCQINTDPMKHQVGHLNVVIPPDIIADETSGDVMTPEGSTVKLVCRAHGFPEPRVEWRREDGRNIVLRPPGQPKNEVLTWDGPEMVLEKVARDDMGAYLCIASNDIPPAVSKRMVVQVHFHPLTPLTLPQSTTQHLSLSHSPPDQHSSLTVHSTNTSHSHSPPTHQNPNQLVGAPPGTNVTLECEVEASPKSINFWTKMVDDQGIEIPRPLTTAQELLIETVGEEIEQPMTNKKDILGPLPEDRHAAPQQGQPIPTKPPPPSRPHNTHMVPYSPTSSSVDLGGSRSISICIVMLMAALLASVVAVLSTV
ncbi:Lachesin-like 16 [Homarus americanus]|uniref:Lachesin-like 16 n=1 Tax=Homarus americanus TaxID=6706 RepID=A0A8J5N1Y7_HOMAM|nr:Lachesin-like 16 [Homarus americanus]